MTDHGPTATRTTNYTKLLNWPSKDEHAPNCHLKRTHVARREAAGNTWKRCLPSVAGPLWLPEKGEDSLECEDELHDL
eukprot:13194631-Alexandrium_andersonii.AAC.1